MVQQHNEKVSSDIRQITQSQINGLTTQAAPRFSPSTNPPSKLVKTTQSSDQATTFLSKFIASGDDNVKTKEITTIADLTTEEGGQLSDLQREAVLNLELITQLVQQVHQLGLRADRVLSTKKLHNRVVKFEDQRDNEIDDEEYYQYENE